MSGWLAQECHAGQWLHGEVGLEDTAGSARAQRDRRAGQEERPERPTLTP